MIIDIFSFTEQWRKMIPKKGGPRLTNKRYGSNPIITIGSDFLSLEVEVEAAPVPTVDWVFNNKPLSIGGRITTNMRETFRGSGVYKISMRLSQVTSADQGVYQAVVKNRLGQAVATFSVTSLHVKRMYITLMLFSLFKYNLMLSNDIQKIYAVLHKPNQS